MNPAGCWVWPVYIPVEIQRGPGDNCSSNYDWLLDWEAVDAVGAGRSGDASRGHASLTRRPAISRLPSSLAGTWNMMLLSPSAGLIFLGSLWGGRFSLP